MFRHSLTIVGFLCLVTNAVAEVIDGEEFIDPTRPLFFSVTGDAPSGVDVSALISNVIPSSWDVSFLRASGSSPVAVVNNERVTIGDSVGGAEVVEIDRNSVTLLINNEERRISIFDTALKTQAQN